MFQDDGTRTVIVLGDIDTVVDFMDEHEGWKVTTLEYRWGFIEYMVTAQENGTWSQELFELQNDFPGVCLVRPNKNKFVKIPPLVIAELLRDKDFPFTINRKTGKIMRKKNGNQDQSRGIV